jgi:hypothetical protein
MSSQKGLFLRVQDGALSSLFNGVLQVLFKGKDEVISDKQHK